MGIDRRSKRQRIDSEELEQKELNLWQKYGAKVVRPKPHSAVEVKRAYYKCSFKDCLARLYHDVDHVTAEHIKTTALGHLCGGSV